MNQFIIGSLLGMEIMVDQIKMTPCFPEEWPSVTINYRFKTATYTITVYQEKDTENSWWKMDNEKGKGNIFPLLDDGEHHDVEVHVLI